MSDEHVVGEELQDGRVRVVSYESFDALMEDQREFENQANEQAHLQQKEITWGDYVISKDREGMTVWSKIIDRAQHLADETSAATDLEEIGAIARHIDEVYHRGYRFGRWYSKAVPEGEWGTKHIVSLWKVTEEEFNAAQINGWEAPEEVRRAINNRIAAAMPDDQGVQLELARQEAVEQVLEASGYLLYEELRDPDTNGVSEDFMRGVVTLGMFLTDVDPSEADRWLEAIRIEMVKISAAQKVAREEQK